MEIMQRGGGIVSTTTATRNESFDGLVERGRHLLDDMLAQGITTVEGKRFAFSLLAISMS
jgi:imidazolonepropionase